MKHKIKASQKETEEINTASELDAFVPYYYQKTTKESCADTELKIRSELKERGFGIITEIDVKRILKEKLNLEISYHKILGACNPQFAHQALMTEPSIGVLLPCNIVIREQNKITVVESILPTVQLSKAHSGTIVNIAKEVEIRLREVVDNCSKEVKQ